MHGEQRLIIATCEKGLVEDVNDMKDIKAGIDEIKDKYPNFVDFAAHEVFRPVNAKSVADPIPRDDVLEKDGKERIPLMQKPQEDSRRHSARAEYLHLRAAVQRISGKPGRAAGEYYLFRLHQFRTLSRRRQPRRHRSLLPGEDRHFARLQPDPGKASQEAAECDFLPHVRRAYFSAGENCRGERMSHGDRNTGNGEGCVHQRERRVRRAQREVLDPVLNFADRKLFAHQMLQAWQPILGLVAGRE